MKKQNVLLIVLVMMVAAGNVTADEGHHAATAGSKELERVKTLAGRWEGTTQHGTGAQEPAAVEYKVTSGGSAVIETLFPGTPHEMVSVYHDEGDKLAMTHYCMLGNQPRLQLISSTDKQLELSLAPDSGIGATEQHMHAVTLAWTDANHLTQAWSGYQDGKPHETTTITLSRVQ